MAYFDIALEERPYDSNVAAHTVTSYTVLCPDMKLFFHDTWHNIADQEVFESVRNAKQQGVMETMGTIANKMRNSFRVPSPFGMSDTQDTNDENSLDAYVSEKSPGKTFFQNAARRVMMINSATSLWRKNAGEKLFIYVS